MRPGDILVCAMSTPASTPLFLKAAGIVTETGGALSSLATAAREHGIPVIVSVHAATTELRDGEIVSIDGATGVVVAVIPASASGSKIATFVPR